MSTIGMPSRRQQRIQAAFLVPTLWRMHANHLELKFNTKGSSQQTEGQEGLTRTARQ